MREYGEGTHSVRKVRELKREQVIESERRISKTDREV